MDFYTIKMITKKFQKFERGKMVFIVTFISPLTLKKRRGDRSSYVVCECLLPREIEIMNYVHS